MNKPLWKPSDERIKNSNMVRFIDFINETYKQKITDYETLYEWSINHIPDFWAGMWQFAKIKSSNPYSSVIDDLHKMPGAKWFSGSRLNFAENLLRFQDGRLALIFKGEGRDYVKLSYGELYNEVARVAASLKECGVKKGDRVVGFMPNMPETIIAMLSATSMGAVWSSCSPDFGIKGVLDRFGQIKPKVLFTADGYFYKGKCFNLLATLLQIHQNISSNVSSIANQSMPKYSKFINK